MIYPSGDKLEALVESRYSLVVLAAKRAKQLRDGAPKLIETTSTNPLTVALEEIAAGKVTARMPTELEILGMETRRREALATFDEAPEAAEEALAAEEAKPSVQELLRVEGEEETPEPEEEAEEITSVADLLKIDDDEPLSVEDIEVSETEPAEE
jgi:DNA-directed RNA polymerase omega subunit